MRSDIIDCLAVFRLTRLVTEDVLTAPARDRFIEAAYVAAGRAAKHRAHAEADGWSAVVAYDRDPPKLATLVVCGWCAGLHCAIFVVWLRRRHPRLWAPIAEMLALSAGTGLLAERS